MVSNYPMWLYEHFLGWELWRVSSLRLNLLPRCSSTGCMQLGFLGRYYHICCSWMNQDDLSKITRGDLEKSRHSRHGPFLEATSRFSAKPKASTVLDYLFKCSVEWSRKLLFMIRGKFFPRWWSQRKHAVCWPSGALFSVWKGCGSFLSALCIKQLILRASCPL